MTSIYSGVDCSGVFVVTIKDSGRNTNQSKTNKTSPDVTSTLLQNSEQTAYYMSKEPEDYFSSLTSDMVALLDWHLLVVNKSDRHQQTSPYNQIAYLDKNLYALKQPDNHHSTKLTRLVLAADLTIKSEDIEVDINDEIFNHIYSTETELLFTTGWKTFI